MKITNNDICKKLAEPTFSEWVLMLDGSDQPYFFAIKNNSAEKALKFDKKIPLNIEWTKKPTYKQISKFTDLDWAKIYKNSIKVHVEQNGQWVSTRQFICKDFRFVLPRPIERIIAKQIDPLRTFQEDRTK